MAGDRVIQQGTLTSYIHSKAVCRGQGGGAVLPYVTSPRAVDSPYSVGDAGGREGLDIRRFMNGEEGKLVGSRRGET